MDIEAPMPATVLEVLVAVGDRVELEQEVVVLESMKMEIPVASTGSGTVAEILCSPGDSVAEGDVLIKLTSA